MSAKEAKVHPTPRIALFIRWLVGFQPERPKKGAKDEVKRPKGPPTRSGGLEGHSTSLSYIAPENIEKHTSRFDTDSVV